MDFLSCTILFAGVDAACEQRLVAELDKRGLSGRIAVDGRTVFAGFDSELPNLLVVQDPLPDMSAAQLCLRPRLTSATRGLPVVVLVSQHDAVQEQEILERGADV